MNFLANKKKKSSVQNQSNKPQTKAKNEQTKQIDEENIPVQSLSEMLAFAQEAEAAHDAKIEAEAKSEPKAEAKPEPKAEAKSELKAEVKSEPKAEAKSESKAEAKPEPKAETKPEPKAEAKPEPKAEAKPESKAEAKPESKAAQHKNPDGMPISAAEAERQAASLDALDRDLANARKKKLQEEAYAQRQRDIEKKKEEERLAKAEQARQRHINAAAMVSKKEEAEKEIAQQAVQPSQAKKPSAPKRRKNAVAKSFNRNLSSMAAGRAAAVLLIVTAIAYGGAFMYVRSQNDEFYGELGTKLSGQGSIIDADSVPYSIPSNAALSADEKSAFELCEFLADSDKDGLTDEYEIKTSKTDPLNPDSDGDGLADGREVRAGLDPLASATDGSTPDAQVIKDIKVASQTATADISGISETAYISLNKVSNNSIQGTPGIVGSACEFYSDRNFDDCLLTFRYNDEQLAVWNSSEDAICVFRFNDEKLVFEKIESLINKDNNTISAHIKENGIYAVCDGNILAQNGDVNIFFLIDNSGSMYPEELCENSEENDVEFKRLDFAVNLIDMLGDDVNYGAAEFSGNYTRIVPVSDNKENVKQMISDIRNKNQVFSGTEIAGAITNAVNEFADNSGADKNYIILLTDGMPSVYDAQRENAAVQSAMDNNITIFTIGLGKYIDSTYLSDIADRTNGQFFQASNADALENIYDKISNFMSYNQIVIEEESGKKGYIVADSGFNVLKDGIGYRNFRADFAPDGADPGIAGVIRAYYTGELEKAASGYTTADGREIPGYDISGIDAFADGKADLKNISIPALEAYSQYLAMTDKWDYRSVKGGVLHHSDAANEFIASNNLKVTVSEFDFSAPEEGGLLGFLRKITFNSIKDFTQYEFALVDSSICEGDDLAVISLLRWYSNIVNSDECEKYDFGYEGDEAFEVLMSELTTGSPAVIIYGGSAMNAVRVARDADNPDVFVIDAYDSNNPDRTTKIDLIRTPVYDGGNTVSYQYTASRGGIEEPLLVVVS